jgi:type VI secretion system protein ImpK
MTSQSRSVAVTRSRHDLGLMECFHEFHAEVARLERAVSGEEPPAPEAVKSRLLAVFERQSADARRRLADHEQPTFKDAQYVMVAMADEAFLLLDWSGRDLWTRRPLEAEEPFSSHVAGEQIFRRIEAITREPMSVPGELLSVYLAALALDFQGKYRHGSDSASELSRYRRMLAQKLEKVDYEAVRPTSELCPQAYDATLAGAPRRGLPTLRAALLVLLIVVLCWLFIGLALWYFQTLEVSEQINRIEDANEQLEKAAADVKKAPEPR